MPYCNVYVLEIINKKIKMNLYFFRHYPQQKPTVVADNPEMQRIRLLIDTQSNVLETLF